MSLSGVFPIEHSDLYYILIEERGHIEKNKWYLSEKYGYEVSIEFARYDWQFQHRKKWWDSITGKQN